MIVLLWWTQVMIITTLCILRNIRVLLDACVDKRCNTSPWSDGRWGQAWG